MNPPENEGHYSSAFTHCRSASAVQLFEPIHCCHLFFCFDSFTRDQLTISEVNIARVYNWDVKMKRAVTTLPPFSMPTPVPLSLLLILFQLFISTRFYTVVGLRWAIRVVHNTPPFPHPAPSFSLLEPPHQQVRTVPQGQSPMKTTCRR